MIRKSLLLAMTLLFILSTDAVQGEDRKLITSDEFEKELSRESAPQKGSLRLRGIKNLKPKPPQVAVQILFEFGKTEIADDFSRRQLDEAGKALSSEVLSKYRFEIAGHTDSIGSEASNLRLSEARARAVREYLCRTYGISVDRLVTRGYGESMPVAANDTKEGRARNRRVVFKRLDRP